MEPGGEQLLGGDEVDRFESRKAGQQIEVGLVQAVLIRDPVGDGDDDVPDRIGRGRVDQAIAQRVLVDRRRRRAAALVAPIHGGEKARLAQHPLGAAIELGVAREALLQQLFEPRHALSLPPQLVVEAHHLGHEAGPQRKRRRRAGGGRFVRGRAHHHLALGRRQTPRRIRQARAQPIVELLARDEIRQRR